MIKKRIIFLFFALSTFTNQTKSQTAEIPAFTGYSIPFEPLNTDMFSEKKGLINWTDLKQSIHYYPYFNSIGEVKVYLVAKTNSPKSFISVYLNDQMHNVVINKSNSYQKIFVGKFKITVLGYQAISIVPNKKMGKEIASLQSIKLEGTAVKNIQFNKKERRNAASVHLKYPIPDSVKAFQFYTTINVPEGNDHLYSYYMATGFKRGYFGMQVNSESERRIIFSVWDAGKEPIDRKKVPDSNKVMLNAKGLNVITNDFGNEGTGGHSHWVYPWKTNTDYGFLVNALPDSASNSTIYTGYFHIPETNQWKLIASFKAPRDGNTLQGLYSFIENFIGVNGNLERQAIFKNQWIQIERGKWIELTHATFSYDATGKAGDRFDYNAYSNKNEFVLSQGGFKKESIQFGDTLKRDVTKNPPIINLTHHVDSVAYENIDKNIILQKVKEMGGEYFEEGNVFYSILKEGNGRLVNLTDTVTVHYKGSLLNDGSIFDQTKEKPATFPLNRLIKGWQIAVPKCKIGGTIRIIIPSNLAYSIRSRSFKIPPNSILVFDVEVIDSKISK